METKKRHPGLAIINFMLFFFAFIIHYTDSISISIKNAVPIIILPLLTAFAMFSSPAASAAVGLITGICMDGAASGALCFNAAVLMLAAALTSVCANNLFNRNVRSALLLSVIVTLVYFVLRWACFYAFSLSARDNLTYLLSYAFPSVIYTNIFVFPFYFLYKHFNMLRNE